METDMALAVFKPSIKNNDPRIPPKRITPPKCFFLPVYVNALNSIFLFISIWGRKANAAPRYNNPANWKLLS